MVETALQPQSGYSCSTAVPESFKLSEIFLIKGNVNKVE